MRACRIAFAALLGLSGCFGISINGDGTWDGGGTASTATGTATGTGGLSTGGSSGSSSGTSSGGSGSSSGGTSTGTSGGLLPPDAGTCLINGQVVAAGTWIDVFYGSCTYCDPAANPNDWTELDEGSPCHNFAPTVDFSGPATVPIAGSCLKLSGLHSLCTCSIFGSGCTTPTSTACCGGFCGESGSCIVTQNLGWPTACYLDPAVANPCAQGPCCGDAGRIGGVEMGWCCGLADGGEHSCLTAGNVCAEGSDCCAGLSCEPADVVFDAGESYGVCR